MSDPGTRRVAIVTLTVTAVAVLAVAWLSVLPGFQATTSATTTCGPLAGTSESVDGRAYWACQVPIPAFEPDHFYANYTLSDFTFGLHSIITPGGALLNVTITEPGGTSYTGDLDWAGPPEPPNYTTMWFTPDDQSGVTTLYGSGNASLLVEP